SVQPVAPATITRMLSPGKVSAITCPNKRTLRLRVLFTPDRNFKSGWSRVTGFPEGRQCLATSFSEGTSRTVGRNQRAACWPPGLETSRLQPVRRVVGHSLAVSGRLPPGAPTGPGAWSLQTPGTADRAATPAGQGPCDLAGSWPG